MKIGTLNVGHQTIRPRSVPHNMLDALAALDTDLLFLTEFVATPEYETALSSRWGNIAASEQLACSRSRFQNQVVALSRHPLTVRNGLAPVPDACASTNFISVQVGTLTVTGVRAPAYVPRPLWYAYWDGLRGRLDGDIVIGDLNVDPARRGKKDRVLPNGWQVVTPHGHSYRSLKNGSESTIDHALVQPHIAIESAEYRPEFFGRWKLDHCPLLIDIAR